MINHKINESLQLDRIHSDILGSRFMDSLHDSITYGDWKNNKRRLSRVFKLSSFEPFDKFDMFGDACHLRIKQKLFENDTGFVLANTIKLDDKNMFPDLTIQYNILFNTDCIECDVRYDCKFDNDLTKTIYDSILRIGLENLIQYHRNRLLEIYQNSSS